MLCLSGVRPISVRAGMDRELICNINERVLLDNIVTISNIQINV